MYEQSTNQQGGQTNDRNDSSGSGLVGSAVRSDSGREEVPRGRDGRRRGGGLHLGVRGVDQVEPTLESSPLLLALQQIRTAIEQLNETIKYKSRY